MTFHQTIAPFIIFLFIIGHTSILINSSKTTFFYNYQTIIYTIIVYWITTCLICVQNFFVYDLSNFFAYVTNVNYFSDNLLAIIIFFLYKTIIIVTIFYREEHLKLLNKFSVVEFEIDSYILINRINPIKLMKISIYTLTIIGYLLICACGFYIWSTTYTIGSLFYGFLFVIQMGTFIIILAYIRCLAYILWLFVVDLKNAFNLLFLSCSSINWKKLKILLDLLKHIFDLKQNFGHLFGSNLLINLVLDFSILTVLGFSLVITTQYILDNTLIIKCCFVLLHTIASLLKNIFIVVVLENIEKEVTQFCFEHFFR